MPLIDWMFSMRTRHVRSDIGKIVQHFLYLFDEYGNEGVVQYCGHLENILFSVRIVCLIDQPSMWALD